MTANVDKLLRMGKALWLAYDYGLEHGPLDFNLRNVNPEYPLNLALEGQYTGIILHAGIAEKYYNEAYKDVPLILKVTGNTTIPNIYPISKQICSVDRAVKLGAAAVGYTIYDGSPSEPEMLAEFGRVVDSAHDYGLPVVAWMYPHGPTIGDELNTELLAYSARIALELGADFVKLKYNHNAEAFSWIAKVAGRTHVVVSEAHTQDDKYLLSVVRQAMDAGVTGFSMGYNIWHHPRPYSITKALHQVIFYKKSVEEAAEFLRG